MKLKAYLLSILLLVASTVSGAEYDAKAMMRTNVYIYCKNMNYLLAEMTDAYWHEYRDTGGMK